MYKKKNTRLTPMHFIKWIRHVPTLIHISTYNNNNIYTYTVYSYTVQVHEGVCTYIYNHSSSAR